MNYKQAVDYINNKDWYGGTPGLDRIRELLRRLGNPQEKLRFVHIAGTNGKGSCAAMTASVLQAAGYRTGLFTSPYLYRFNERMQINGEQIPDDILAEITTRLRTEAEAMEKHPNVFELITAAAMMWYAAEKCDIVVLETGLGGRFDATNVIERPEVSVIMNIGLDHTAILGDTPEKIAWEKAGIIKPGCPCVLYEQQESVTQVIRAECAAKDAQLHIADFSAIESEFDSLMGQAFIYKNESYAIPLLGRHQLKNAAVVLEAAEVLRQRGFILGRDAVERGLYGVQWPARFELLSDSPYFVVDGGHNPQCAQTVAENMMNYFPDRKKVLLTGVLSDKDYRGLFEILAPVADEFVCITPDSPRAMKAEELARYLQGMGKKALVCSSIREGVDTAVAEAGPEGAVCAVGSLYISGPIRACFNLY